MCKLSIIIPCYSGTEDLSGVLTSIDNSLNVKFEEDIEILLIGNNINTFNSYYYIANIIKNINISSISNLTYEQIGIMNASGEYLILIDEHDMFASCLSIQTMLDTINKNPEYQYYVFGIIDELDNRYNVINSNQNTHVYGTVFSRKFLIDNDIKFIGLGSFTNTYLRRMFEICGGYQFNASEIIYFLSNNNNEKQSVLKKDYKSLSFETFYGIKTMFTKIKELNNGDLTFYLPEIVKIIYELTYNVYSIETGEDKDIILIEKLKKIMRSFIKTVDPDLYCLKWTNPAYVNEGSRAYLNEIINEGGVKNV